MRRREEMDDTQGYDSFLDIVANLVGILLILIIVIGAQAADAMISGSSEEPELEEVNEVARPKQTSLALEFDINEVSSKIKRQELEVNYRRRERDLLNTKLAAIEVGMGKYRGNLDDAQRKRLQLINDLEEQQQDLQQIQKSRWLLENESPQTKVLEHLPTPMAKTVFGKELHFRLIDGHLTYIPWEQLLDRLKKEVPSKLWKLDNAESVDEKIGPVYGFLMHYTIKRMRQQVETRAGVAVRETIGLERFHFEPIDKAMGEPVDRALTEQHSKFSGVLAVEDPGSTTVTIWVYPNSFERFREVREHLYKRGFAVAGRPLTEDRPIGGSVYGSRSVAQ
ncbi:MAG: hypothetical protein ACI9G1_004293 [Pirellulaceae bacterium]|jgi:hypothetical protein